VEKANLGGTCLNVGCIPTKALLHTAEIAELAKNAPGLHFAEQKIDWNELQKHKEGVTNKLVRGIQGLLKANKVTVCQGTAKLAGTGKIVVNGSGGNKELKADYVILAAGSEPVKPKIPGLDLPGVLDSTKALALDHIPESIVIMGGGVIGMEFAWLFHSVGSKVTVVEAMEDVLPMLDPETVAYVKKQMQNAGVELLTDCCLNEIKKSAGGYTCVISGKNSKEINCTDVLVAVGRRAATADLGLETLGVTLDRGRVVVDENMRTNLPWLYAIGDCNGVFQLAHAASAQGTAAAEHIFGVRAKRHLDLIPACVYTSPELAAVGLTEKQAKEKGIEYVVGKFALTGNGKSLIENGGVGMVKIIAGKKYGELLGIQMAGPRVTEMIGGMTALIASEATLDELTLSVFPHPTVSEAIMEAALDAKGEAIHAVGKSK